MTDKLPAGWSRNRQGDLVPPSGPIDIRTSHEREIDSLREDLQALSQRVRKLEILLRVYPPEHDNLCGLAAREVGTWEKP